MRGPDEQTHEMFSYLSPEARVRQDHPLRAIRQMTDDVFKRLSPRFARLYSDIGRPSIPPEQLLGALLLQSLYTIRSERLLMEEIDYSILFRWFTGLSLDEPIWSPTSFSKRIAIGCWPAMLPRPSLTRFARKPKRPAGCPMSTSRSTARCSRRGPVSRAFSGRMRPPRSRPMIRGTPR